MIKIYLNHISWNIHPVYQEMLDNPPDGVEYINSYQFWREYQKNVLNTETSFWVFWKILKKIFLFLKKGYILPNITFKKLPWNIIYSCQSIPLFWDYILDLDCYEAINRFSNKLSRNPLNKCIVKFLLKRRNCKKIVFWSDNAKTWFEAYFWKYFEDKSVVISPAIKVRHTIEDIFSWKDTTKINILFVGRYFERKGWDIVLDIANSITKKYSHIYFNFITQVPENLVSQYKDNSQINFLWLLEREKVVEYFKKSDFFIMPTFNEIFGMVFLEAFAYGAIPITMNTFATNNIIDNWQDGFVLEYKNKFHNNVYQYIDIYNSNIESLLEKINGEERQDIVNNIIDKIEFFIKNHNMKLNFVESWFNKVKSGKFSIEYRNQAIYNIFYEWENYGK